jgi:hypothetical protein
MKAVPDRIEGLESVEDNGGSDDERNGQLDGLGHGPRQSSCVDRTGSGHRSAREVSQILVQMEKLLRPSDRLGAGLRY